ncbi:winged helix-turn-helix domain-containing protein [Mangrovibacter phragmitis]|uniref:winged helix-turn-helix domain-containing protein n=1 Tax=Mangrovibacter phragmitis TaxID=1691903 RepID=UPI003511D12A
MTWLIASTVIYNPEDGVLTHISTPDDQSITLTTTANLLLALLIHHQGIVVERDTLLHEIWDQRGLRGSSSSLNQYISILRKTLSSFGLNFPTIITVPRVGFMFNSELVVSQQSGLSRIESPSQESRGQKIPLQNTPVRRKQAPWLFPLAVALASILFVVLTPAPAAIPATPVFLLTQVNQCPVYTFTKLPDDWQKPIQALAKTALSIEHLSCQQGTVFYLHAQDAIVYQGNGQLAIIECSLAQQTSETCLTHYFRGWSS